MKVLSIQWTDSHGVTSEWEFQDELKDMEPILCTSIGILEKETDQFITIFQTTSDKQVLGRMTIPRCSIISIREMSYLPNTL